MDDGRRADLAFIDNKLRGRDLSRGQRRKLERAKSDITHQQKNKDLKFLRDRYIRATAAGDSAAIEKYGAQLTRLEHNVKV